MLQPIAALTEHVATQDATPGTVLLQLAQK